ncbi:MAG: c-type cytochrome [Ignavibacteriaceae bacterium]|nr:c-type cytochrome [Ignavibacteriaceae bacterium]
MKILKILGISVFALVILAGAFLLWFNSAYPKVSEPGKLMVQMTPEQIARGKYLANHVTVCMDCHSTRDWSKYSGPMVAGTEGKGGDKFTEELGGVPGTIYSPNITPAGIGDYTDGELLRAFTQGVTATHRALFPLMPYTSYNKLSMQDAEAIIAYIRTLEPIQNEVPVSELNFPMNLIVKTIPLENFNPSQEPDTSNFPAYGKYLTTIAGCGDCHTPTDKGTPLPGMEFAGGFTFQMPGGLLTSSNITPDKETGIGTWTKEQFITRFKSFASDSGMNTPVTGIYDFNTVMPWTMYAGMTEQDLGAIYEYLTTLKPVANKINRWDGSKQLPGMMIK